MALVTLSDSSIRLLKSGCLGRRDLNRLLTNDVHRYLLRPPGPLFDFATAQHDITFACIIYLTSSFTLIDPHYSKERRLVDVAKGWHGLQRYANEYWIEHLLTSANTVDGNKDSNAWKSLLPHLYELCNRHRQVGRIIDMIPKQEYTHLSPEARDPRSEVLREFDEVYLLVESELAYQQDSKMVRPTATPGEGFLNSQFTSLNLDFTTIACSAP